MVAQARDQRQAIETGQAKIDQGQVERLRLGELPRCKSVEGVSVMREPALAIFLPASAQKVGSSSTINTRMIPQLLWAGMPAWPGCCGSTLAATTFTAA